MKNTFIIVAIVLLGRPLDGQERKPVPKDSVRVSIPGCSKGYVFTAGPRTTDEPGGFEIPEGMHLRMNGPKKMIGEIKAHEESLIEITGLMKKGQFKEGVNVGGGIRIAPWTGPTTGGVPAYPPASQFQIDVEGWRPLMGACRSK